MSSIKDLAKLRRKLLEAIKTYPESKVENIFYENWTIKEVIGHISAWDIYFTKLIKNLEKNTETEYWGKINEFNKIEVAKRKGLSLRKLINELEKESGEFIKTYTTLKKEVLNKKFWKNKKYTPKDILKIQIHHYESQIKQIEERY